MIYQSECHLRTRNSVAPAHAISCGCAHQLCPALHCYCNSAPQNGWDLGGPQSNHGHEAFPSFAILTSYHVLSVDLPTQHLTDLKGSSSSPYKGRNVFLSERGGCSAAESLRWLLFNLWFIPSLALRNNWLKNSSLLRTDLTNMVTRVCLPSLASGRK